MTSVTTRRAIALTYGLLCHGGFLVGVGSMAYGLLTGLASGHGPFTGATALAANLMLVLQFPLLHSFFLARHGRRIFARLAPFGFGRTLAPTIYAIFAAAQIGVTFTFWSPTGVLLWEPEGVPRSLHLAAFGAAWVFLVKALHDAGLGLQTGSIGWMALWRGESPSYPGLPERGLFAACRQPIYLGFALVLWTAPIWTLDHLVLAIVWGTYCVVGPLLKERRFEAAYGAAFASYKARVPYFVPKVFR